VEIVDVVSQKDDLNSLVNFIRILRDFSFRNGMLLQDTNFAMIRRDKLVPGFGGRNV
jgi:hypothetical protein